MQIMVLLSVFISKKFLRSNAQDKFLYVWSGSLDFIDARRLFWCTVTYAIIFWNSEFSRKCKIWHVLYPLRPPSGVEEGGLEAQPPSWELNGVQPSPSVNILEMKDYICNANNIRECKSLQNHYNGEFRACKINVFEKLSLLDHNLRFLYKYLHRILGLFCYMCNSCSIDRCIWHKRIYATCSNFAFFYMWI